MPGTRCLCLSIVVAVLSQPGWAQAPSAGSPLDAGIYEVNVGDFEAAIKTLDAMVEELKAQGGQAPELSRAYLYLAIAHLGLSQEQAAKAKFIEAIKSDQALSLSPFEFPPRVIEAFEAAKDEAAPLLAPPPPTPAQRSAMFEASKAGDFGAVRRLLGENPALATIADERFGATPLHWAALRGHEGVAALLIGQGADPGVANRDGETPLQVARRAKRAGVAEMLGSGLGGTAPSGGFFSAVKDGDVAAVRAALEWDPSQANQKDARFGATPLHWAALRDHEEVARELIAHGADINARNRDGETPLRVAERSKRKRVAQLLREAGSRPSLSALLDAAKRGEAGRVEQLATEVPSLINEADAEFGATALHWAALRGHAEVVKALISHGADLTVTNKDGETPLRVARRANRSQVVELLRRAQSGIP